MIDGPEHKWVLPPSLYQSFIEFQTLYETLNKDNSLKRKNQPILIMGPPGVGKTLFSEVFAAHYSEDNKISDDKKIVRVNVAAFPETLIESTLFGHIKGAFTDAQTDQKGFVEDAAGGILILDEIGELSKEVQAKLLTFIEDNYYYKIGATKPQKSAGIQIIATTNRTPKDNVFRQDFIDRFFPFYIPPLYKRRGDILYHWAQSSPDLIGTLAPWEVLAIVAYHWPGNVREIERIGNLVRWEKAVNKDRKPSPRWFEDQPLIGFKPGYTLFSVEPCFNLYRDLTHYGIDLKYLQDKLSKYRISLSMRSGTERIAFPKSGDRKYDHKSISLRKLMIEIIYGCNYFTQVYKGLEFLCSLLKREVDHNANLLDLSDGHIGFSSKDPKSFIKKCSEEYEKMIRGIHGFIDEKASTGSKGIEDGHDILSMTEKEMIEHYHKPYLEGLLKKTSGNKTKASKIAGIPLNTFRDHCNKYGLS